MKLLITIAVVFFIHSIASVESTADEVSEDLMFSEPWAQITAYSDLLSSLDERIVYVEPQYRKGYWTYAEARTPYLGIRSKDQLLEEIPFKWKVHYLGGNKIALESMQLRNQYMSIRVNRWKNTILKSTGHPASDTWVHIEPEDLNVDSTGTILSTYIKFPASKRYGKYQKVQRKNKKLITLSPDREKWNIYVPDTSDEYITVAELDNSENSEDAEFQYEGKIGMEVTRGEVLTESTEKTVGFELQGAFKAISGGISGGVTHTSTWQKQTSETWSRSTTLKFTTDVPAGKKIELRQLIGYYGDSKLQTHSNSFQFVDSDKDEVLEEREIYPPYITI